MESPRFSFVMLSFGRVENLSVILDNVLDQPFVDDAVVVHQGTKAIGTDALGLSPDKLSRVLLSNDGNWHTYRRFTATRRCRHDSILTCDDDNLVHDWPKVAKTFIKNPEVIAAGLSHGHLIHDPKCRWGEMHEVLLGFGAAFDRRWISEAFSPYIAKYGCDELLHRKADRLFSMLLNRLHQVFLASYQELPGATDRTIALYRRDDHCKLTDEARQRAEGNSRLEVNAENYDVSVKRCNRCGQEYSGLMARCPNCHCQEFSLKRLEPSCRIAS